MKCNVKGIKVGKRVSNLLAYLQTKAGSAGEIPSLFSSEITILSKRVINDIFRLLCDCKQIGVVSILHTT